MVRVLKLTASFESKQNNNQPLKFQDYYTMVIVADNMVACTNAGARSIPFVVKGGPAVQSRNIIAWKGRFQPILLTLFEQQDPFLRYCQATNEGGWPTSRELVL